MAKLPTVAEIPLTAEERIIVAEAKRREKYFKIQTLYPAKGKLRRSLYKKHLLHFLKGATYRQRLFMAGNRVGKTTAAAAEFVFHATGLYPDWWEGRRYTKPQTWWLCGTTSDKCREIFQDKLLGKVGDFGSGWIPQHLIDFPTMTNARKADTGISDFRIRHVSGEFTEVHVRSYDQGRKAFEGIEGCIWMDEEPPYEIYAECLMRILTGEGNMLFITFTPNQGKTKAILTYMAGKSDDFEGETGPGKWITRCTMADVPHLNEKDRIEILSSYPENERKARELGIPQLGAGAVYPVDPNRIFIAPFDIPEHFRRVFAMDYGYTHPNAILWGAVDPQTECLYIYAEDYQTEKSIDVYASVIKTMNRLAGFQIPGVADPSGGGKMDDGRLKREVYYREYEIALIPAENALEAGITTVRDLLVRDKIKIFETCQFTKREYQSYYYSDKGKLTGDDHAMDCLRYIVMTGTKHAKSLADVKKEQERHNQDHRDPWAARRYWERWGF